MITASTLLGVWMQVMTLPYTLQGAVVQKLLVCGLSLLVHLTISSTLPVEYNIDERFQATASWPTKVTYLYMSLLAARPKYYFAWTLGKLHVNRLSCFRVVVYLKADHESTLVFLFCFVL